MRNLIRKLPYFGLCCALAISATPSLAGSYVKLKDDIKVANKSSPTINVYLGNARAEKERVVINTWVAECWNDKIDFTTFDNGSKKFVSVSAMDHNGMLTFRGEYNTEEQTFEGTEELSRYWDVSVRGEIKGEYAEGSIWYTLKNDPGWNTDGFCISHFRAKKKDI
jgi:hypothetical protein